MNAYEFGQQVAALEKQADVFGSLMRGVGRRVGQVARSGPVRAVQNKARQWTQQGERVLKQQADDAARAAVHGPPTFDEYSRATANAQRQARSNRSVSQKVMERQRNAQRVDPLTLPLSERYKATPLTARPQAYDAAPGFLDSVGGMGSARALRGQALGLYHGTPGRIAGNALDLVGGTGQFVMNQGRRALNKADDLVQRARGLGPRAAGQRFGDTTLGRTQAAAKNLPEWAGGGSSAMTNPRNALNLAVGAGTGLAGLHYGGKMFGGSGDGQPSAENINSQQMSNQMMQGQHMETRPQPGGNGGGLMDMWNSLPIEARYAIGAGVPLALAGAFMGGRGNYGMGGTMGALGLGAAGLGAAGAGMFGDGPRRLVGQGANALYGMAGGGGNPMDQINALSRLSPEFGTTMLMGRDPNMNSEQGRQMYDFLTHNRNIIEQLMPQLQGASVTGVKQSSALNFGVKLARCWEGYEPVPGKKPYSNDSCRPASSKKKTKKEKAAKSSAPRGKTEMSCAPSGRGTSKLIDDKQRETNSPQPTGAGNVQQTNEKVSGAGFKKMELMPDLKKPTKKKPVVKKNELEKDAGIVGSLARGLGRATAASGRGIAGASRVASRAAGAAAGELGGAAVNRGGAMARAGAEQVMRGGVGNVLGGSARAVTGAGMYGAGQLVRGAGNVAQWAGSQVPGGSRVMNAARTATALPIAAGIGYGGYQMAKPAVDPYISSAQQFGADTYNAARQNVSDAYNTAGSAASNAVQTARSYIPNVRNPFYYDSPAPGPNQTAARVAPLPSGRVSNPADL